MPVPGSYTFSSYKPVEEVLAMCHAMRKRNSDEFDKLGAACVEFLRDTRDNVARHPIRDMAAMIEQLDAGDPDPVKMSTYKPVDMAEPSPRPELSSRTTHVASTSPPTPEELAKCMEFGIQWNNVTDSKESRQANLLRSLCAITHGRFHAGPDGSWTATANFWPSIRAEMLELMQDLCDAERKVQ